MSDVVHVLKRGSEGDCRQVVMFPFGGGNGFSYMGLAREVVGGVEVLSVHPPGHLFDGSAPLESIGEMVDLYVEALRPMVRDGVLVFGHSIGSFVGYEFCKRLEGDVRIGKLVVSCVNAPHRVLEDLNMDSGMADSQIVEKSASVGGMPEIFMDDPDLLDMFVKNLRADLVALERYSKGVRPDGERISTPGVVLYGKDDYTLCEAKVGEWRLFMDCVEIVPFEGNHFYLFDEGNIGGVGEVINRYLAD
jgi:external thioesterase TEII